MLTDFIQRPMLIPKQNLKQIKTYLLDRNLPNKKYIIGKTNLLKNFEPIPEDQDPHTDFKHQHA